MRSKMLFRGLVAIVISALIVGTAITVVSAVTPSSDELLGKYKKSDLPFNRDVTDNKIIYWHQRKIDEAIVEKDFMNYQFDKDTKELIKKTVRWRHGLPEHLPPIITKEEAESMVSGKIMGTRLLFISPDSWRYPIKPTPKNPCWIVSIADDEGYNIDVIIIDAVEGKVLGHGVPFPSSGFSFSGPQNVPNCSGVWDNWYQNAESWFNTMGELPDINLPKIVINFTH